MKPITCDIKFFEANITHQRNGNKNHFFKNKTNAILIDLKNKSQRKISKYPSERPAPLESNLTHA